MWSSIRKLALNEGTYEHNHQKYSLSLIHYLIIDLFFLSNPIKSLTVNMTSSRTMNLSSYRPVSCQDAWPGLSLPLLSSPLVVLSADTDCSSENNERRHEVSHNGFIYCTDKGETALSDFTSQCM